MLILCFFVSNVRYVFEVMITVTQIDIAMFSVIVEQIVSIITVNLLVNEKKFEKKQDNIQELELMTVENNLTSTTDKSKLIVSR